MPYRKSDEQDAPWVAIPYTRPPVIEDKDKLVPIGGRPTAPEGTELTQLSTPGRPRPYAGVPGFGTPAATPGAAPADPFTQELQAALTGLISDQGFEAQRRAAQSQIAKGAGGLLQKLDYGAASRGLAGGGRAIHSRDFVGSKIGEAQATVEAALQQQRAQNIISAVGAGSQLFQNELARRGLDIQEASDFVNTTMNGAIFLASQGEFGGPGDYEDYGYTVRQFMEEYAAADPKDRPSMLAGFSARLIELGADRTKAQIASQQPA